MGKTLQLSIWERMWLLSFAGQQSGAVWELRKWMRLVETLEPTAKEREALNMVELPNGSFNWDAQKAKSLPRSSFALDPNDAAMLREAVRKQVKASYVRGNTEIWPVIHAEEVLHLHEVLGLEDLLEPPEEDGSANEALADQNE
jgi:hypothetical protein